MKNTLILEKRRTKIEIGKNYSLKRKIINLSFNPLWKQHQELDMLKDIKLDYNDLWIEQQGKLIELYMGDKTKPCGPRFGQSPAMSNILEEHKSMYNAAKKCSKHGRALTAGLGLGLVILYLAKMRKPKEIVVIEKEKRLVEVLQDKLIQWFSTYYPQVSIKIIVGDIYDEITKHGTFDWIYLDLIDSPISEELHKNAKKQLNKHGVYLHQGDLDLSIDNLVKLLDGRDKLMCIGGK